MNQQLIEKFLNNTCTVEEAEQVVTWFSTTEGQHYLAKRLEEDARLLQDERIKPMLPELDSAQMWREIDGNINQKKEYKNFRQPRRKVTAYRYAAVIILLVGVLATFFAWKHPMSSKEEPIHFITKSHQHQTITLGDGTTIKLNSNSQLWIAADYGESNREVTLKGEAYFEVIHDKNNPFVIHAHGTIVKDLGTVFNVRAMPNETNVQVAVKSGKVLIRSKQSQTRGVKLTAGQFGYVNLETDTVTIDAFAIQNYLSWVSGGITFKNAPLKKVSRQLSRMYDVSFKYASDSIKDLSFSANFTRGSLKKALEVISLTLSIDYQKTEQAVVWSKKE